MKTFTYLSIFLLTLHLHAQQKPTIVIDIPTDQKPWSKLTWNQSESQFQFAIVTDRTGGHRPGVFPKAIQKLNLLQPEFVMSVGDFIEGYTEDTARLNAEWVEFNGFIDSLKAPFFYVPGNHDITNAVQAEKWEELFGVSYYHFVYNDVLFLCLNSEDNYRGAGRGTIDDEQYAYIEKVLKENADVKWTMVFLHQPLWVQEDTKRWKDVEKLLNERKHYVFAGHYHRYWKTVRNQGNYIALATTGGGSALRGRAYGEFDHVVWVTMTEEGPILANLFIDGIWDENVVTEELVELVRNQPFPVTIEPVFIDEKAPKSVTTKIRITNPSDTKMSVKLTGEINKEVFYTIGKTELTVEPNDVEILELNLTNEQAKDLSKTTPIKIKADITYLFENQPNVNFSDDLVFTPNYKYSIVENKKVKLDGNLKEWTGEWITLENWEGRHFDYGGEKDCDVKFSTAYDDQFLYLALDIKDEELYVNENASYWGQDGIIIGIDARPERISAYNDGEGMEKEWLAYLRTFKEEHAVYVEDELPTSVKSAVKKTSAGAQVELAIPVSYLDEMQGKSWSTVRVGVGYYDFDENGEERTTHFWFPAWNTSKTIPGSGMMYKR